YKSGSLTVGEIQVLVTAVNTSEFYTIATPTLEVNGYLKASATITPVSLNSKTAVAVFVLTKDGVPVSVVSQSVNTNHTTTITSGFNVTNTTGYAVKVHVVDQLSASLTDVGRSLAQSK